MPAFATLPGMDLVAGGMSAFRKIHPGCCLLSLWIALAPRASAND
jgi:hypothetical protein